MMVNMRCTSCGADLSVDDSASTVFCKYCGNRMEIANAAYTQDVQVSQTVNVVHTIDRSNEPNLYINYMSINPSVIMVTRIAETGQKNTYISGQTMTFHLTPGKHIVVLKIGKINYNRAIYIPEDNRPVRINAAFTGRASINIDQPPYTIASDMGDAGGGIAENAAAAAPMTPGLPKSPFSILAFVLSFLIATSPIAVVLGILDLTVLKNKEKSHGLSIAAIAIGVCMSIIFIPSLVNCSGSGSSSSSSFDYSDSAIATPVYKETVVSNVSELSQQELGIIVGTYVGEDGSVLIFHKDGTCDYYYKSYSDMERENPWMFKDDYLVWHTDDMNCNVYVEITDSQMSSLYFRSSSFAWSDEEYTRVSLEEKDLTKAECDELIEEYSD